MEKTKDGELEDLREENHRLKLSLQTTKQTLNTELEYLKEELQCKDKEFKLLEDKLKAQDKKKKADIDGEVASLTAACDAAVEENSDLKKQLQHLQRTIDQLKQGQNDRLAFQDQNESLKARNDRLNIELTNIQQLLDNESAQVNLLSQQTIHHVNRAKDFEQRLDDRESYIKELQSRMKELENDKQEAFMELQHALMLQQNVQQEAEDPTRRGNSLFREVDERRVRVEEELFRQRELITRLMTENHELKSRAELVKSSNSLILRQLLLMEKNEVDVVKEFKKLESETTVIFSQYRDKIEALKSEYKRKLVQFSAGVITPAMGELETVRSERDLLLSQKIGLEQEIWDLRIQLKFANSRIVEWEARCLIFRAKLVAFQDRFKCGWDDKPPSLNTTLNGTMVENCIKQEPGVPSDVNDNKQWFRDIVLDCTPSGGTSLQEGTTEQIPSTPRLPLAPTSTNRHSVKKLIKKELSSDKEELPECNQQ